MAAAISLFGFESGAALATVVGVLIEVPVMLSVVKIVNARRAGTSAERCTPQQPARRSRRGSREMTRILFLCDRQTTEGARGPLAHSGLHSV